MQLKPHDLQRGRVARPAGRRLSECSVCRKRTKCNTKQQQGLAKAAADAAAAAVAVVAAVAYG